MGPDPTKPQRAGDVEPLPGGRISFLAPLPLPTGESALNEGAVSELNDTWLDYGAGWPGVFGNQLVLGGAFKGFLLVAVVMPLVLSPFMSERLFNALSDGFIRNGLYMSATVLIAGLWGVISVYSKRKKVIPTRFHRQRREVCFVPEKKNGEGYEAPVFVPWESLRVWIFETRGVTQYGVQQQYGMGIGYVLPGTNQWVKTEFMTPALPLALAEWEALRGYMEYEINTLDEIQSPLSIREEGDPPWEGAHTIRNAHRRLHRRRRNGEVGWFYTLGWYLYHLLTFWTLPGYLAELETWLLRRSGTKSLPPEMLEWSKPLPKEQWAKPSEELVRLSEEVRRIRQRDPQQSIEEVFAEAYRDQGVVA
ncbi:hypothetical protein HOP60_16160 [Halomonas daqingensis]|uniref:Uncharacterized protein n=2 Tax=Billgrantia desiderata TaxID=52021 RepID=A0ABS9B8N6_9GAMM|nr:hypothetical protein [Halomonas desiderata]MCE8048264.1 hypothetical protein [Halomonas desiderata]